MKLRMPIEHVDSPGERPHESAASLPELLLAGAIALVALGSVVGTVLAPLDAVSRTGTFDEVQVRLEDAAARVASSVREARATLDGPAVHFVDATNLRLRKDDGGLATITTLRRENQRLLVETTALPGSSAIPVSELLFDGLDPDVVIFRARTALGTEVAPDRLAETVVIEVRLRSEGREVVRHIRIRELRP